MRNRNHDQDVVGLVPAAGSGKRIAPLPCSKELFPIGFQRSEGNSEPRVKVVSHYLLEKFRIAGIATAYIVLREGKWDIPAYFSDGAMLDMHLAYVVIPGSFGPPDTLDRAYSFVRNKVIVFGFPDILFGPDDVFAQLLQHQTSTNSDVVLGLYLAHDSKAMDMVDIDANGRIHSMVLKPAHTHLRYAWVCGVWSSVFTEFMHEFLASPESKTNLDRSADRKIDAQGDVPIGAVIQAAIRKGLRVDGVSFPDETYVDIGTPEDLVKACRIYR